MQSNKSISLLFAPFSLKNMDANSIEHFKKNIEDVSTYSSTTKKLIDSSKYYDFVKNFVGNESNSYLKSYCFNTRTLLDEKGNTFASSYDECKFYLDKECSVEIKIPVMWILVNEIAETGFLIYYLELYGNTEDHLLISIEKTKTFRYFRISEPQKNIKRGDKDYALKVRDFNLSNDGNMPNLTFYEIFEKFYFNLKDLIVFTHIKPVMLHIFDSFIEETLDKTKKRCFNVLRIPPSEKNSLNYGVGDDSENHTIINEKTFFYAKNPNDFLNPKDF